MSAGVQHRSHRAAPERPRRAPAVDAASGLRTALAVAVVSAAAATFAHLFRESLLAVARLVSGEDGSVAASRSLPRWVVFLAITFGLTLAAFLGRVAVRWRGERLGLTAVAAAARGEGPGPSMRGTLVRASGTWVATASLASLGRESAIIEAGAGLGTVAGRVVKRPGGHLAATGITAAFTAAYHAPVAAVLYAEEHLGVRQDRRTVAHAIAGSVLGLLFAQWVLGAGAILPAGDSPLSPSVALLAVVGLLPAYLASRLFVEARERLACRPQLARPSRARCARSVAFAAVAGAIVAFVPLTAGNGMEALRHSATDATLGVALALLVAKLVATTAAVGSGAPGGVLTPSLAVAAGAALATFIALDGLGVNLPGSRWDGMLVAMAVGLAVSVRSPLVAVVMVAEMAGDLRLLPLSALVVLVATRIDRAVDRGRARAGAIVPEVLHDEDA